LTICRIGKKKNGSAIISLAFSYVNELDRYIYACQETGFLPGQSQKRISRSTRYVNYRAPRGLATGDRQPRASPVPLGPKGDIRNRDNAHAEYLPPYQQATKSSATHGWPTGRVRLSFVAIGQKDSHKQRNDGNHREKLYQCKAA
jgi:hypothetical protein